MSNLDLLSPFLRTVNTLKYPQAHLLSVIAERLAGSNGAAVYAALRNALQDAARAAISISGNTINCDADPVEMEEYKVWSHTKGGVVVWDELDLNDPNLLLNANVLDHLLTHQTLIPEAWKKEGSRWRFAGTLYGSASMTYYRYLQWVDGEWRSDFEWIDDGP